MPLVSIITPVYNAARWLPETLAAVRAQTLSDWEHILVDDCSADGSQEIIQSAAQEDTRVRLLRSTTNHGPTVSRNMALEAAQGRFIAFLDADDLWEPEKLARSVELMMLHGYEFTYHDYRHMSEDGSCVGEVVTGPDVLNMRTLHTRRGTGCLTVVIDRLKIQEIAFKDVNPYHGEDFCLWSSLVRRGYTGHRLHLDLARYRLLPRSRSANKFECAINTWRIYRIHSGLSMAKAAFWWIQYAWNAFWLHYHARPRFSRSVLNP